MVQTDGMDDTSVSRLHPKVDPTDLIQDRTNHSIWMQMNDHNIDIQSQGDEQDQDCVALGAWQGEKRPSCLALHEIDMNDSEIRLVGSGGYRHAWMIHEFDGSKRALKTLRYKVPFTPLITDKHRRDAMAMAELSASPYVSAMCLVGVDMATLFDTDAIIDYRWQMYTVTVPIRCWLISATAGP